jgi:hypothetical protein
LTSRTKRDFKKDTDNGPYKGAGESNFNYLQSGELLKKDWPELLILEKNN